MKKYIVNSLIVGALLLLATGCSGVDKFTSRTVATYNADGSFSYNSDKDNVGFDASLDRKKDGELKITVKVESASTSDAALKAANRSQELSNQLLERILSMTEKAAAMSGS